MDIITLSTCYFNSSIEDLQCYDSTGRPGMNVSKQGSFDKNGRSKFKGGMSTLATARDEECSDYDDVD
jgi:hypothetical protein